MASLPSKAISRALRSVVPRGLLGRSILIILLPILALQLVAIGADPADFEANPQGYDIPDYPDEASSVEDKDVRARYDRIKGSAVNPVLREGNSDRRAPLAVKNYAKKHPHRNKAFADGSKTRVATLGHDDFRSVMRR